MCNILSNVPILFRGVTGSRHEEVSTNIDRFIFSILSFFYFFQMAGSESYQGDGGRSDPGHPAGPAFAFIMQ